MKTLSLDAVPGPFAVMPPPEILASPQAAAGLPVWVWIAVGALVGIGIGMFLSIRNGRKKSGKP